MVPTDGQGTVETPSPPSPEPRRSQAFDGLCAETGGVSDTEALLGFLHHNGVVFYRSGLFRNQIILDQNWALDAIYSIFHREKCVKASWTL
jgi:hypothetical protein